MSMSAAMQRINELERELRCTKQELKAVEEQYRSYRDSMRETLDQVARVEEAYRKYRNTVHKGLRKQGALGEPPCES